MTIGIQPGAVYTLAEACNILQVSEATLRRWLKDGRLPSARIGRGYRFLGSQLLDALTLPEPASEAAPPPTRGRRGRPPSRATQG
jgi:excisionase family DNA binding protein